MSAQREWTLHVQVVGSNAESDRIQDALMDVLAESSDPVGVVSGHAGDCTESDHCCGPGSNYLRDQISAELNDAATLLRAIPAMCGDCQSPEQMKAVKAVAEWLIERAENVRTGKS